MRKLSNRSRKSNRTKSVRVTSVKPTIHGWLAEEVELLTDVSCDEFFDLQRDHILCRDVCFNQDETLRQAVYQLGGKKWSSIATWFDGRTPKACANRWNELQNTGITIKRQWSDEEDNLMRDLVNRFGPSKWAVIASYLPGRNGKQCRERWHNQLNPSIRKDAWTPEEDKLIIKLQIEHGNSWAKIAECLPGRTDNSVKNRWHSTILRATTKRCVSTTVGRCKTKGVQAKKQDNLSEGVAVQIERPSQLCPDFIDQVGWTYLDYSSLNSESWSEQYRALMSSYASMAEPQNPGISPKAMDEVQTVIDNTPDVDLINLVDVEKHEEANRNGEYLSDVTNSKSIGDYGSNTAQINQEDNQIVSNERMVLIPNPDDFLEFPLITQSWTVDAISSVIVPTTMPDDGSVIIKMADMCAPSCHGFGLDGQVMLPDDFHPQTWPIDSLDAIDSLEREAAVLTNGRAYASSPDRLPSISWEHSFPALDTPSTSTSERCAELEEIIEVLNVYGDEINI